MSQVGKGLIVAPQPVYEDRGTPIALRQVMQALSELGHEVDILTYPLGRTLAIPGISWHRISNPLGIRHVPVGFSLRKLALDLPLAIAMSRRLARTEYAWVHAVEEAAFPAVLAAHRHGVPVLYDMQSSIPQQLDGHALCRLPAMRSALRRCEAWLLERADLVVASAGLASYVDRIAPGTPCREWHFPGVAPAVDSGETARLRQQLSLHPEDKVVVYCGTFEPYQGLSMLVDAAAIIHRSESRCRFVLLGGNGQAARGLARQAERLGVQEQFRFVPCQPRERVWAYLGLADVAISPRCYGDNLPLKILDYMAMGMPIVATEISAHMAALDKTCAQLVPPTPEGLAQGILDVIDHPEHAAAIGSVAGSRADTQLGWERFVGLVDRAVSFVTSTAPRVPSARVDAASA